MWVTEKLRMRRKKKLSQASREATDSPEGNGLELTLIFSQLNAQSSVYKQELRTPWEASPGQKRALDQSRGRSQCLQVETILCSFPDKIMILLTSLGTEAISHQLYGQWQLCIASQWCAPLKTRGICAQNLVLHGFGIHPSFHQNGWKYVNIGIIFMGMFTRHWWTAASKCLQEHLHQKWLSVYCLNCMLIEHLWILAGDSWM